MELLVPGPGISPIGWGSFWVGVRLAWGKRASFGARCMPTRSSEHLHSP